MTLINIGTRSPYERPFSGPQDGVVRFRDEAHARQWADKIVAEIETTETEEAAHAVLSRQDLTADALALEWPALMDGIEERLADHCAALRAGAASIARKTGDPRAAVSAQNAQRKTVMLNLGSSASGEIVPYIKYNAKAGRWYIRGEDKNEKEVANPLMVIDLANLQTGWFLFSEGKAPERTLDPTLSQMAPRPSPDHKRGFQVMCFASKLGGKVELASNSMYVGNAISALYAAYDAGKAANAGLVPLVQCTGVEPIKGNYGTNYQPVFAIVKWIARPAELDASPEPAPAPAPAPKPAPAPQPAPVAADFSDF